MVVDSSVRPYDVTTSAIVGRQLEDKQQQHTALLKVLVVLLQTEPAAVDNSCWQHVVTNGQCLCAMLALQQFDPESL